MPEPRITTVIPTYRRPRLLRRAVASALAQTYPHVRVSIFDNASGDETPDVVAEIAKRDPRVTYHCHRENLGGGANFEFGMESVETPYFSFLSDDDVLLPGFYELAMTRLKENPEARFFCGQAVVHSAEAGTYSLVPSSAWENRMYRAGEAADVMARALFIWTSAVFSRETVPEASMDLVFGDVLFMVKAAALFPFVACLVPCAVLQTGAHRFSPVQLMRGYSGIADSIERSPRASRQLALKVRKELTALARLLTGAQLRSSFVQGDWRTFDEAVEVFRVLGGMTPGKRARAMLARKDLRPSPLLRLAQGALRMRSRLRARRRAEPDPMTFDQVVELYRDRASDAARSGAER